jgi:hypothetical protein
MYSMAYAGVLHCCLVTFLTCENITLAMQVTGKHTTSKCKSDQLMNRLQGYLPYLCHISVLACCVSASVCASNLVLAMEIFSHTHTHTHTHTGSICALHRTMNAVTGGERISDFHLHPKPRQTISDHGWRFWFALETFNNVTDKCGCYVLVRSACAQ